MSIAKRLIEEELALFDQCRCDCVDCACGEHLGCYYKIDGVPECPIARLALATTKTQ